MSGIYKGIYKGNDKIVKVFKDGSLVWRKKPDKPIMTFSDNFRYDLNIDNETGLKSNTTYKFVTDTSGPYNFFYWDKNGYKTTSFEKSIIFNTDDFTKIAITNTSLKKYNLEIFEA